MVTPFSTKIIGSYSREKAPSPYGSNRAGFGFYALPATASKRRDKAYRSGRSPGWINQNRAAL
jgi:hypothetical protein